MAPVPEDPAAREPIVEPDVTDDRDEPDDIATAGPKDTDTPESAVAEPGTAAEQTSQTALGDVEPALVAASAAEPGAAAPEPDGPAEQQVDSEDELVPSSGDLHEGALVAPGAGTLQVPLSPVAADRIRWSTIVTTVVGAIALLIANASGYAPTLVVTLALALAVSWGWPVLSGSFTPDASTIVLAVSAVAIVLGALRDDLRWVAAAVAFGIVLSFSAQLLRRTGREGLVLTLMSSFGGLAVIASGATGVVAANSTRGTAVAVVAMTAVAVAVVADLLAGVQAAAPVLGLVALVAGVLAGALAASRLDDVGSLAGLGIGAAVATLSWSFRRVLALEPAMTTLRGQVGAGAGSVVAMGALVHLFTVFA